MRLDKPVCVSAYMNAGVLWKIFTHIVAIWYPKITIAFNPSAWSDGHCAHAARSHSFVYISTS